MKNTGRFILLAALQALLLTAATFAEQIIVDNVTSSPHSFTTYGSWPTSTDATGYYGSNYTSAEGSSTSAARWRPYITTSGIYKIYMKWTSASSRPDRAPIEINYDGGTKTDATRRANQKVNGGSWVYIGSYYLASGTGNSVRIKASDAGRICADAVLFELSYATTSSPTKSALTTARAEYTDTYGQVLRPDAAPATIYYNGGSSSAVLTIDQTENDSQWVSLGTYYLSAGTGNSVKLSASDAGTISADAVKFELASNTNESVIVDNITSGTHVFTTYGTWTTTIGPKGFYGTDYLYNDGSSSAVVRWRPDISTAGNYTVYIRWADDIDLRDRPQETLIVRTDSGENGVDPVFELRIEGEPFEVKGSCGHEAVEEIAAAGGNTIRAYSTSAIDEDFLRRASEAGTKVILGLWLTQAEGSNSGFYDNATSVSNQFATLKQDIDKYKNHESILAWVVGNEVDPTTVTNPEPVYAAFQQVARYIREVDHYHPSLTAHAGAHQTKISRVVQWAPDIDIIGVNSYYPHVMDVTSNMVAAGWTGPHFITEYFLRQPMTMQNETNGLTSWGAVIEPVSAEKYTKLLEIYADAILAQIDRGIGSFVFKGALSGFRVTHTWYPLLDENLKPTPSYDAMRECWEGDAAPGLLAPEVESITLNSNYPWESPIITGTGGVLTSKVTITAPTHSTVEYEVEIRTNATLSTYASPPPLEGITITQNSVDPRTFYIRNDDLPDGDYRLFYYVKRTDGAETNGYVSVGTANIPFRKDTN